MRTCLVLVAMAMKVARHPAFIPLLLFVLALLPRALTLGRGLTTDEAYHWVAYRSGDFLAAVSTGHFAETMITGHPGVTTMWLGSLGLLIERMLLVLGVLSDPAFETHLALVRLPMALATAGAVVGSYLLLRRVVGVGVALVAALLWATDPFLVAHSRLLHLDALLAMTMLLATLALLAACFADGAARARPVWSLLVLAGAMTGLAMLTKSLGVVLLPIGVLILAAWRWQCCRPAEGQAWRWLALAVLLWGGAALVAAVVAWPALWVVPVQAVASVVREVLENAGAPHPGTFLLGEHYITDEPGALFYPVTLAGRLTPWVAVGLVALVVAGARRWPWLRAHRIPVLLLAGAALLLPLLLIIPPKKFDRYALPAVPLLHVLAACGLCWIGALLPSLARRGAAALTVAAAIATLLFYHPYYLAYYNPLMGGSAMAPALVPVGWGEGLDVAAEWLNTQPDRERGQVATWSPPTLAAYLDAPTTWQGAIETGRVSYMVVYINQAQTRKESQYFGEIAAACTPVHTTRMFGIDYARIYRVPTYTPRLEASARIGDTLVLRDGVLVPPAACSCEPYTLTLVFAPLAAPEASLFLFLHVVGPDGVRPVQLDLPLDSLIPATSWETGEEVPYTLQFALPAGAPAGTYRMLVGLYDVATGERLPVVPEAPTVHPTEGSGMLRVGTFEHLPEQRGPCADVSQP